MGHYQKKVDLNQLMISVKTKKIFHLKALNFLRMRKIININHIEKNKMNKKVIYN